MTGSWWRCPKGDGCRKVKNTLMGASALVAAVLVLGETVAGASSGTVIKEPQYGFFFHLPANWKQAPLDGRDVTALLNSASHLKTSIVNNHLGSAAEATYQLNLKSSAEFGEQLYLRHGANVESVTITPRVTLPLDRMHRPS